MKSNLDDVAGGMGNRSVMVGLKPAGTKFISTVAVCLAALRTYLRRRNSVMRQPVSQQEAVGNRQSCVMQRC
jgi:hypothetical protein